MSFAVKRFIDFSGDWLNLCRQLSLNHVKILPVIACYEVDSETEVAESARPPYSMEVRLRRPWEVKVNHNIDRLDVDSPCEKIGADKVSAVARPEVVENPVSVLLKHSCVYVVATETELGDLL